MGWIGDAVAWFQDPANWQGPNGIPHRLLEHVGVSAAALGIAASSGSRSGCGSATSTAEAGSPSGCSNVGRAVPTFAVLVILVLAPEPFGLSTVSIITALVLFALPPLLTNTYSA